MLLSLETCHKLNAALFGRPEVNQRISKAAHIKELNTEIDKLKEELFATREKNGVYLPADHWESQQVCLVACSCGFAVFLALHDSAEHVAWQIGIHFVWLEARWARVQ